MNNDQYEAELNAYLDRINDMDDEQYKAYMRDGYEFEDEFDAIPEYMDYVDQWSHDFDYQACKYVRSFIIDDLATRNAKMKCGDHEHIFHLIANTCADEIQQDGTQIRLTTETSFNYESCWYKTVLSAAHRLQQVDTQGLIELTEPDYEYFTTAITSGAYLLTTERDEIEKTYYLQTKKQNKLYGAYKNIWFHGCSEKQEKGTNPTTTLRDAMGPTNLQKLISGVVRIKRKQIQDKNLFQERITLLYGPTLLNRHDFHIAFKLFSQDKNFIVNMMNKIRGLAVDYEITRDLLTVSKIEMAIHNCKLCRKPQPLHWSTPGIYYAPPGSGKSTSLEKGFLAAFDTDWLTSGLTEKELNFLLERDVPVITNQYTAFSGGMTKMIGYLNPDRIRFRPGTRTLFTEPVDVRNHSRFHRNQFTVVETKGELNFMLYRLIDMRLALYLANYTRIRFIKRLQIGVKV